MSPPGKHSSDPNLTTVWLIPLEVAEAEIQTCLRLLSEEERARAERFRFEWLARRYIVAHGRMRSILAHHSGVRPRDLLFQTTPHGKPFLNPALNIHFNLSHSGEIAILAVGKKEMGVDVEFIQPIENMESIAEGFFSPKEVEALARYPSGERLAAFYRCWTRKEAYVKAIGEGLSIPLHSFVVSLSEGKADLLETSQPASAASWTMAALDIAPITFEPLR